MNKNRLVKLPYILLVLLTACQSTAEKKSDLTVCAKSRPQICTMIYAPVCAQNKDAEKKTYASDCMACSYSEVVGYTDGVCE